MRKLHDFQPWVMLVITSTVFLFSCGKVYKVSKPLYNSTEEKANSLAKWDSANKYFILRNGDKAYAMNNLTVSDDGKNISSTLARLPEEHIYHVAFSREKENIGKNTEPVKKSNPLNEVHLYIPYDSTIDYGNRTINIERIGKMEIVQYDKGRANRRVILATVATVGTALVLAGIIAIASSCPYVSAYDGENFLLQGEIYGGAIYPQLARNDYLPLKMHPLPDGSLQIKISNELKEKQYTDLAELWVITHSNETKIYVDEQGNLHEVSQQQVPRAAVLNDRKDVKPLIENTGDKLVVLMNDSSNITGINNLDLSFDYPGNAKTARLIIDAKNSYFLDMLYGKVAQGLGNYYSNYVAEQKTKSAESLRAWVKEQNIPLSVYIKNGDTWRQVSSLNTIGPLANREIVVPFDIPANAGPTLEVRISCGFYFWEIDKLAIDFGTESPLDVEKLSAKKALDQNGKDVTNALAKIDKQFLLQPSIGDATTISFYPSSTNKSGYTRSYILHANGHYEHIRDFKNKPDLKFLTQFKSPGAMSRYGMELYRQVFNDQHSLAQKN